MAETGKPIPEVAEKLGVHPGTLHSWVSRAKRNGSPSSDTRRIVRQRWCSVLRGESVRRRRGH
ncbi:transposase [Streptomyces sp. SCSIO 30461]